MNISRSKKPKRFGLDNLRPSSPSGVYRSGLAVDEFCVALGAIAAIWPHVEEAMISIMSDLLHGQWAESSRQVFRSIVNQQTRLKVMRTLLERGQQNRNRDAYYDDVLAEFESLNRLRNRYLHGLWWTFQDNRVYLAESTENFGVLKAKRVQLNELEALLKRMDKLTGKVYLERPRSASPAP